MKYFIDTEFVEGTQKKWFGKTQPTIDLISIGIVNEEGDYYYAISKEFNLKEAWNRYDLDYGNGDQKNFPPRKVYWLRENVLKPIWNEMLEYYAESLVHDLFEFSYTSMKTFLNNYGKSRKQIAEEIKKFILNDKNNKPEFYGYYSDYDWVVFCWLFGKMIDLPEGFPKYCIDLQQTFDEKKSSVKGRMKDLPGFPVNKGNHNALSDADWTYELYKFLKTI